MWGAIMRQCGAAALFCVFTPHLDKLAPWWAAKQVEKEPALHVEESNSLSQKEECEHGYRIVLHTHTPSYPWVLLHLIVGLNGSPENKHNVQCKHHGLQKSQHTIIVRANKE